MKYYKFLLESLYKNLIIISKKKTNKFRIKNAKFINHQNNCNGESLHNLLEKEKEK